MKRIFFGIGLLVLTVSFGYGQEPKQPLEFTIKSDKSVYEVGKEIAIAGQLKNISKHGIVIYPREQSLTVTFDVTDAEGRKVDAAYSISDLGPPQKKEFITLGSGKTFPKTFRLLIPKQHALPGKYVVSVKYKFPSTKGYYDEKNAKFVNLNAWTGTLASNIITVEMSEGTLPNCAQKISSLKVGMTRGELEKLFSKDGGLMGTYKDERYVLRGCACQMNKIIKVNVSFKLSDVSDDIYNDPNFFQKWYLSQAGKDREKAEDAIVSISDPYCENPFYD